MGGHPAREVRRQIGQGDGVQPRDQQGACGRVGFGQGVVDRRLDQAAVGLDRRGVGDQAGSAKGRVDLAQSDLVQRPGQSPAAAIAPSFWMSAPKNGPP